MRRHTALLHLFRFLPTATRITAIRSTPGFLNTRLRNQKDPYD